LVTIEQHKLDCVGIFVMFYWMTFMPIPI